MAGAAQGMLEPGGMFGDFRVLKELGRGGMGAVYLLKDEEAGANYAAKILYPEAEIRDHKDAVGRFLREAEIAMAVEHPNLVHVYAVGRDPETRLGYMIMDYLPGGSLHDLIMERLVRKQGPLPVRQSVALVRQIASALCAVERNGVVHRDIKSENILFDEEGVAKLTDLGIAKRTNAGPKDVTLTVTNVMIGTPAYMAPEHLMDSKKVDIRSDIYSLGIVLWEMLAGEPPNAGLTTSELIAKASRRKRIPDIRTKRPHLPRRIVILLRKMTSPRAEARFQHPEEILTFLDEYAERTRRKFQIFLAGVAAVSSVVLLLAVWILLRAH